MEIKGKRITITPIELKDAYSMKKWGRHKNPLLFDYNLPSLTDEEIKEWYRFKTRGNNKKYYSVFNEQNRFIGYMGIKNIRKILSQATFGIVFDPNYVNQGYGTEAIIAYLYYFFNEMKMRTLYLEVAKFNKRAIQCYEKSGFKVVDVYLEEFFDQKIDLENPYFLEEKSSFVIEDGKVYNYIYKMKIDKKTFLKETK
ncbi:MAG: GNAT family N-acetyltransferase [Tissierellia bacterium]|nr:GNAT family N-acetyltransferase [Tissierellia bacterium]